MTRRQFRDVQDKVPGSKLIAQNEDGITVQVPNAKSVDEVTSKFDKQLVQGVKLNEEDNTAYVTFKNVVPMTG